MYIIHSIWQSNLTEAGGSRNPKLPNQLNCHPARANLDPNLLNSHPVRTNLDPNLLKTHPARANLDPNLPRWTSKNLNFFQ